MIVGQRCALFNRSSARRSPQRKRNMQTVDFALRAPRRRRIEGSRRAAMDAAATSKFRRALVAEGMGTMMLLAAVVGSGVMAENLAAGNDAVALLGNTLATAAMLAVLITIFAPLSGAHFNPAVTLVFLARRDIGPGRAAAFIVAQVLGALAGTALAHLMFELDVVQVSAKTRTGGGQWLAEGVATFGLLATILATLKARPSAVAAMVGLYIAAGYWFTASTSFANPAVALARSFTDTFSGIAPADAPAFILAQLAGAACAWALFGWLLADVKPTAGPGSDR